MTISYTAVARKVMCLKKQECKGQSRKEIWLSGNNSISQIGMQIHPKKVMHRTYSDVYSDLLEILRSTNRDLLITDNTSRVCRVDLKIFFAKKFYQNSCICICDCQNCGVIRLKVKRDKDDVRKPSKILE